MADVVGESIDGGAVGFSTNRYATHELPDGRSKPRTFADPIDVVEITKELVLRSALPQAVGRGFQRHQDHWRYRQKSRPVQLRHRCDENSGVLAREYLDHLCNGRDLTAITQVRGSGFVFGLRDRGTLTVGMRADVNVFDVGKVARRQPELVNDFPGGAPRFIHRSIGYEAAILNGKVNVTDGQQTGVLAGSVLRHGR